MVGGAAIHVTKTPATSSTQMNWGSFAPTRRTTRAAAHHPSSVRATALAAIAAGPKPRSTRYRGIAPKVPAVPGATGTRPHPNQIETT